MAAPHKRHGFTLVELLVVITIIGMLMALLLPAIQTAREAGRRNTCANNVRQVAIAMSNFHDNKRAFPGYANVIYGKRASWVVSLLPYMERNDLYQIWQTAPAPAMLSLLDNAPNGTVLSTGAAHPFAYTQMNILMCPSDPNDLNPTNGLSYVVNCGSANHANNNLPIGMMSVSQPWPEDSNSGIFFNHAGADNVAMAPTVNQLPATGFPSAGSGPKVSMDFISINDGTSYTLMVTENLQAGSWATDPTGTDTTKVYPWQSEFQIKQNTGFVWFVTGTVNNGNETGMSPSATDPQGLRINSKALSISPTTNPVTFSMGNGGGLAYSRPSSAHPGAVNAVFCDGHSRLINDDVDYRVYTALMTPRGKQVIVDRSTNPPYTASQGIGGSNPWNYTINEADY